VAWEIPGFSFTLPAGDDFTHSQFCACDVDDVPSAIFPTEGLRAIGVIQNKPDIDEPATIVTTGITKVLVGVTGIKARDNVTVDDDGTIIAAASGDRCIGVALTTTASGLLGTVLLLNGGAVVAAS
jgi:hypothetical protein